MLKVGTKISLKDREGNTHNSYICLFTIIGNGDKKAHILAVTSAAFTKQVGEHKDVFTESEKIIGEVFDADKILKTASSSNEENKKHPSDCFGFIKINEAEIDPSSHLAPAEFLTTGQRLARTPEKNENEFYVSIAKTAACLPSRVFSSNKVESSDNFIVQGLCISRPIETKDNDDNKGQELCGTPLLAKPDLIAGMVIADNKEKGLLIVPMGKIFDRYSVKQLTPVILEQTGNIEYTANSYDSLFNSLIEKGKSYD